MATGPKVRMIWTILMLIAIFMIAPRFANAQLVAYLDSVTTSNNSDSIDVNVYIDNYSGQEITGYTLYIKLKYFDYIGFVSDSVQVFDTTYSDCVDSSCVLWDEDSIECLLYTCLSYADTTVDTNWVQRAAVDTSGSLTSGWDFLDVSIEDSHNRSVRVNAIADQGSNHPGIPSPMDHGLLCRLRAAVKPYDETDSCTIADGDSTIQLPWDECFCDSVIAVEFDTARTRFSNEDGDFIGWVWNDTAWTCKSVPPPPFQQYCVRKCAIEVTDTGAINYCHDSTCFYMYDDVCYLWECTDCEIWDSAGYVDPDSVFFSHGQIEVKCYDYICGDANADLSVDISDAVSIINYVFIGGAAPNPLPSGDANCDGSDDISDAVYIINFVFIGGNPPCDINGDGEPDC